MRLLLVLFCSLSSIFCNGQVFQYPETKKQGQSITEFFPQGWSLRDSAMGDLNKDQRTDAVVVLEFADSVQLIKDDTDTVLTKPRMLIVLLQETNSQSYRLLTSSNTFILNHDNSAMDDPYTAIRIRNGILEIDFRIFYNMGSWYVTNTSYKFRYQQEQLQLIGADYSSFHRASQDYEKYSYNFLTNKRSLTKGNDSTGGKKTSWMKFKPAPLKTFRNFPQPFTWEIEKDVSL